MNTTTKEIYMYRMHIQYLDTTILDGYMLNTFLDIS